MVGGLGPLLAPPIGGLTQEFWGWRGTLATLAAASVLMLVLAWVYVPESLPVSERRPANLRANFAAFGSLIAAPKYLWFMLAFVAGFSAMIAYISASPFVGQNVLSMSPLMYSLGFATSGTALVLSNILNARIAERVGPPRMLGYGTLIMLLGAVGMLVLSLTGTLQIWSFITCAFLLTGGAGITMSNASALALTAATHARGFGAALLGSTQFAFGGLIAPFVGAWGESTAVPMGVIACSAAAIAALFALLGARSLRVIE
jgi:DHA1 family bicyclomycin/chloramphenicol resistance-like MFS transporter